MKIDIAPRKITRLPGLLPIESKRICFKLRLLIFFHIVNSSLKQNIITFLYKLLTKLFHFKEIDECQGFVLFVSRSCSILCNGKTGTKEKQNHQKVWGVN